MGAGGGSLRALATSLLCLAGGSASAAGIELSFRGPAGERVGISHAELLLVAWGHTERLPPPAGGGRPPLDLSEEWLRARFSGLASLERAYLYVRADGYAPLRSEPIAWPGSLFAGESVRIDFGGGRTATVADGEERRLSLTLRRPQPRVI